MTETKDLTAILLERARKLAARSTDVAARTVHVTVAVVVVGSETFAIPSEFVRGIVPLATPMRLPGLPPQIAGVVHFRGDLLSVVDLGVHLAARGASRPRFLVVVRGEPGLLGLGVEEVVEFRTVFTDEVDDAERSSDRPLRSVTRDLVQILDIPRLVADDALIVQ